VLTYASPAWAPNLAWAHMVVMQRTQNAALRIATGCVRSTPMAHLHAETSVLPIKDYLEMRGTELIESANCPHRETEAYPFHTRQLLRCSECIYSPSPSTQNSRILDTPTLCV